MCKSMSKVLLAAVALTAMSLASAAPSVGAVNTQVNSRSDSMDARASSGSNWVAVQAESWDEIHSGQAKGKVWVYGYDDRSSTYFEAYCSGPSMANALSVWGSGKTTVSALLDPSNPDCRYVNITGPITVNLSGSPDGTYSSSFTGIGTDTAPGGTYRWNYRYSAWQQSFTGDPIAGLSTFSGVARSSRMTSRQQVK